MATKTLGTNDTSSLTAISFLRGIGSMTPADQATIAQAIKDDANPAHPIVPGSFSSDGVLYVPRRGFLRVFTGDYVGVDSSGWPILVSANSIANAAWTHS
jgi:hypothetical protein